MSGRLAIAAAVVSALLLAGCAPGPGSGPGPRRIRDRDIDRANPSAIVAAELAFARSAQEKGQWTAFAEFATDDAVMFVPQPVNARDWLKKQANPAQAVRWQPHQVWSSCDGSLGMTKGAWQRPDGSVGYFTTAWQRQRNGEYRWTMDQGDVLAQALTPPESIAAKVADCVTPPTPQDMPTAASAGSVHQGRSKDGTFTWQVVTGADGGRMVSASYWDGSAWRQAIAEQVEAE